MNVAIQDRSKLIRVVRQGTVYRGRSGSPTQSAAFAHVCVLPNGRWLCAFRAAPTKAGTRGQHVRLTWSDDEGVTWCDPIQPFAPPAVEGRPGLFRSCALTPLGGDRVLALLGWVDHSDPDKPFYNESTEGLLDMRVFLAESSDGGRTWTPPRIVALPGYDCPTPITGPVLAGRGGRWTLPFEVNKRYDDPTPWVHESAIAVSDDAGESWSRCHVITRDPSRTRVYWDQRLARLADGSLLDLFWTYDLVATTYLNIHARRSEDGGATWSPLWDTGVPGQPAPVCECDGGVLVMVYVDRDRAPAIKARLSRDGGRSWPTASEAVIFEAATPAQTVAKACMNDAWSEMAAFSVGLPHAAPLNRREVLAVYYAGQQTDHTGIEWAVLALNG